MAPDYEKYQLAVLRKKIHVRYLKLIELENLDAGSLYKSRGGPLPKHRHSFGTPCYGHHVGNARPLKLKGGAIEVMKIKYLTA